MRPAGAGQVVASTNTRVLATDPDARRRLRRYWRVFSPGIRPIRHVALSQLRRELRGRSA